MHCHLIVSRKDQSGKKKLSPLTNHKNTKNGVIKGGFDRVNLFQQAEQGFDKLFGCNRKQIESFDYHNTMKNSSIYKQLELQERSVTYEKKNDIQQSREKENSISCNLDRKQDNKHSYNQRDNASDDSLLSVFSLGYGNNYKETQTEKLQKCKKKKVRRM